MYSISEAVSEIISEDVQASEALAKGYLNFSAYARLIKPEIESRTYKSVKLATIVVALSRLDKAKFELIPDVAVESISLHMNLSDITVEKTKQTLELLRMFMEREGAGLEKNFFTSTRSQTELTIVADSELVAKLARQFNRKQIPLFVENVAGVTVKFDAHFLEVPNFIFALVNRLAAGKINLVELVSTATEVTFFVDNKDASEVISRLSTAN